MQFCDLNRQYKAYQSEIDTAMKATIESASFIHGSAIDELEQQLANYTGVKHALACSSGTDALLLALMVKGVQPGDEVICPAFSFFASASMISFLKATPVFVDVSPLDFNIDVNQIAAKINSKTKGIMAVSLFGQCADFDAINQLAEQFGLWVIEDGAQSFGALYHGKRSCSLTELAVTSFFPAKPLGCYGDGGAVFTNNDEQAARIRMLRSHGQVRRYEHHFIGLNARMDTLQAAVLKVKLKYFETEIEKRNQAAHRYTELLDGAVLLPEVLPGRKSVWAQYTIGVENRDALKIRLQEMGIPTAVHYPSILPRQLAFDGLTSEHGEFEVADLLSKTVLSLPMHGLITAEEVEEVCTAIKQII
ncbi:MAG: DegT/DnrJ/EryC1/StrS family aminotransferase [Prolixibacteraceae bacterium]|nr:DegT/DnrJ/EryC1/StrS family aminotransferase [Prolixibacteraceae bacterium]